MKMRNTIRTLCIGNSNSDGQSWFRFANNDKLLFFIVSLFLFLIQRLVLLVASANVPGPRSIGSVVIQHFIQWDSGYYISIAAHGYTTDQLYAFFPLYPALIRLVHDVTWLNYDMSSLIISSIALITGLYLLGLTIAIHFERRVAIGSMIILSLFPTSLFFAAAYTESLFFALAIGAIYSSSKGRFWWAGVLAALATLTRNTGVLLNIILLFDYMRNIGIPIAFWKVQWWKKIDKRLGHLFVAPAALLGYCVWLKSSSGQYLAFLGAEKFWDRHFMPIWDTYYHTIVYVFHAPPWGEGVVLPEFFGITLTFLAIISGAFYIRNSSTQLGWWLYLVCTVWISATEPSRWPVVGWDYLYSFPRFILMMFPAFPYLAARLTRWWLYIPVVLLCSWQLYIFGQMFFEGRWVA